MGLEEEESSNEVKGVNRERVNCIDFPERGSVFHRQLSLPTQEP